MDFTVFENPKTGALVIAIWALIELAKRLRPQLKKSNFWFKIVPFLPAILGVLLAMVPGVVDIPEGSRWTDNIGNFLVVGIGCGGIATLLRKGIKRSFFEKLGTEDVKEDS